MSWILDSSPLIPLAKIGRLDLLEELEDQCIIPTRVHQEVVTDGIEEGYTDAHRIQHAIDDGIIEVREIDETDLFEHLSTIPSISETDASVLALTKQLDGIAVMDETAGRDIADTEGIQTRGTAYLMLLLVKQEVIQPEEGQEVIDALIENGWYCSTEFYSKITDKIRKIGEE